MRNLYVLVIYQAGSRTTVAERRESRRPFAPIAAGDIVRAGDQMLRVCDVAQRGRTTEVFTRSVANVIPMPAGDDSVVAQFLRLHVLVRVFDGNPDAWLAHLRARGDDGADVRFARWIRTQLRHDPMLLGEIRRMVATTPLSLR